MAGAVALVATMSACGTTTLPGEEPATGEPGATVPTVATDPALAARVPESLRQAGVLKVGTNAAYPPVEFLAADGKTIEGIDIDLLDAVATTLGLRTEWNNAPFDTIVLGVQGRKWDVGASALTIDEDRKKAVNMVQYFNAGTTWAAAHGNPRGVDPENACGLTVAVQRGTVQIEDVQTRSKECTAAGESAITVLIEQEQTKATADVVSGKADAMLADSPVTAYAIEQTGDQLQQVGEMYDAAPYGFILPKKDPQVDAEFSQLIAEALTQLKADGTYDAILAEWGNESGAVESFEVNP